VNRALRTFAAAALAAVLALPAAGCADDSPPAQPRDGRVDVVLDDFLIDPQRVRARPGRLSFRARNRGRVGHTLRVLRGDREVVAIETQLPGAAGVGSGSFTRGEYKLVCILGNHEELGMYGTLTVR
jgi:plastocyanin